MLTFGLLNDIISNAIISKYMRVCWNRQTGTFEGRVSYGVWVQVPSLAPPGWAWTQFAFRFSFLFYSITRVFSGYLFCQCFPPGWAWMHVRVPGLVFYFTFSLAFVIDIFYQHFSSGWAWTQFAFKLSFLFYSITRGVNFSAYNLKNLHEFTSMQQNG